MTTMAFGLGKPSQGQKLNIRVSGSNPAFSVFFFDTLLFSLFYFIYSFIIIIIIIIRPSKTDRIMSYLPSVCLSVCPDVHPLTFVSAQ